MNRYILEFEKDGKTERTSFEATDDEQAKVNAKETLDYLQRVAKTINKELRFPQLYRHIRPVAFSR